MVLKTGPEFNREPVLYPVRFSKKNRKFRKIEQKPETGGSTIRIANRSGSVLVVLGVPAEKEKSAGLQL
jgi:hypothetical protein